MDQRHLKREIVSGLRSVGMDGQRVSDSFARNHGLNSTDMRALVMIMEAESEDAALTAGQLSSRLGATTGTTTAVIDRLEGVGHIRRNRGHSDRRKVTLHFEPQAMEVAAAFFGPLGVMTDEILSRYTDSELSTILDFLARMHGAYEQYLQLLREQRKPQPQG